MPNTDSLPLVPETALAVPVAQPSAMEPASAAMLAASKDFPLLALGIEKGITPEGLEKLVALQERIMDRNAAAEFADAMAEFTKRKPKILKGRDAVDTRNNGTKLLYTYSAFEDIVAVLDPILSELGLSLKFSQSVTDGGMLTVTLTVKHRNGHSDSSTFSCPVTESTPMPLSPAQKTAGTYTTAKRHALCGYFTLTPEDAKDTDAKAGVPGDCIDPGQEGKLAELLEATGTDKTRFLRYYRAENLSCILAKDYPDALASLTGKLNAKKAGKA